MDWQRIQPGKDFLQAGDPYYPLRSGAGIPAGFASPDRNAPRPVVVLLHEGEEAGFADRADVQVPAFYTDPILGLEHTRWRTALAEPAFFGSLATDAKLRSTIERISALPPIVPQPHTAVAEIDASRDKPFAYEDGATVVMGIIDFGIAFAHERFRRSERNSRVEYMWVQDAPPAPAQRLGLSEGPQAGFAHGSPGTVQQTQTDVHPVPYGQEIRARNIDQLLSAGGGRMDEDSIYRHAAAKLGQSWLRSVSRRAAHGTHVMDLAAGYDLVDPEREQRPIVCVQLPEATTADTSGESLDAYALDGIRYILERADEIARRRPGRSHLPVVINFSFGDVAGPHDGSSNLERAIDELLEKRRPERLEIVIPAGNAHLARLHAELKFTKRNKKHLLHWRVLPDDRTPSFLEIWLPSRSAADPASRIKLSITSPTGLQSGALDEEADGAGLQLSNDREVFCEARYRDIGPPPEIGPPAKKCGMFLIALQPTKRNPPLRLGDDTNPAAPSGIWTVTLENMALEPDAIVEAWIQRDDTPYGFRLRGRQSYFDHGCYQRFDQMGRVIERDDEQEEDCIIKRAGSMNAIATGKMTFVVGGYVRESSKPAPYSAGGPVVEPGEDPRWPRRGPDAIAVSDESRVLPGVLAAGTRSGSVVALNGTSVAAPQAARMKATELVHPKRVGSRNPKPPGEDIERTGDERIEPPDRRRRRR